MADDYTFLDDGDFLLVSKPLARAIGVFPSIAFRQIRKWLKQNDEVNHKDNFKDGCWWAYNTYDSWRRDDFDFWSYDTTRRILVGLREDNLLYATMEYNKRKGDQTLWYTINYGAYESFIKLWTDHKSPARGETRYSVEYQAFMDDWIAQKGSYTSLATCVDQYSKLHRATLQLAQTVTIESTKSPTKKREILPLALQADASAISESSVRPPRPFESKPTVKGDPDIPLKPKKKKQSDLCQAVSAHYSPPSPLRKELQTLLKPFDELFNSDQIYRGFIEQIRLRAYFPNGHRWGRDAFVAEIINPQNGWSAYASSHQPPTDLSFTSEGVSDLLGEGFFGQSGNLFTSE